MGYVFDFVAVFVLFGCAICGFKRGFVRELLDFIAITVGLCLSRSLEALGIRITDLVFESNLLGVILSFCIHFITFFAAVRILGYLIHKKIKKSSLKSVNRYGGLVLAIIKGYFVLGVIIIILVQFPILGTGWMKQSVSFPLLNFGGRLVKVLLPQKIAKAAKVWF